MVEFGDELIIESYRIPWLIWIQLAVTVLLIILLFFGLSVFTPDPSTSSAVASPSRSLPNAPPTQLDNPTSSRRRSKVEDPRVRRDAGTSGGPIRDDDENGEESSTKNSAFSRMFQHPNHPCSYIGLMKQAFFKCFGIDCRSQSSDDHRHEKQD